MQRSGDDGAVPGEAVSGELELATYGVSKTFNENIGGDLIALAHRDVQSQLGMPLDRDERVAVANV